MVIAVNKKGNKQEFSDVAWRLLGKPDKNGFRDGWKQAEAQPVRNVVSNALPTGESAKTTAPPAATAQKVTNNKKEEAEVIVDPAEAGKQGTANEQGQGTETKTTVAPVEQAIKDDFLEAIDGLTASAIKDYFDRVNHTYSKKVKLDELQIMLGELLNYDIEKFQTEFTA